jgi:hypothetical protein
MRAVENPGREKQHAQLNDLVTMAEAATIACFQLENRTQPIAQETRDLYAHFLSRLVTLFAISEDRQQIRRLTRDHIAGGAFRDGGREIYFPNGRETIREVVMTRTALKAAIEVMKRAADKSS